ncbi:MAG TPA: energy transducer TonB [Terracidiphilus sp.]|nr:energy transducer TonB [Terracidiphilus sp.]
MPIRIAPPELNEPESRAESANGTAAAEETSASESARPEPVSNGRATTRWIDYDTHELLEMIGELEDERRWARLREGVLWAVLVHIALILALFLLPKYVFKVPPVVEANLHDKDFTYIDSPPLPPRVAPKPALKPPVIDKQTMDELKREEPPAPKEEAAPPPPEKAPEQPKPQPAAPVPPATQSQSPIEAPRPSAVPARPTFAMNDSNPADQLKRDMENAMRNRGGAVGEQSSGGLAQHPGAGAGAPQILSDTQGVDFSSWLARWHYETQKTWDPLIPDEVNAPIYKSGMVVIRFKVLPNGRLMDGSVMLEGRSGDTALDRAAWGALVGSNYPPLPREFHGPYLELRAFFFYNMQPPNQ